MQFLRAKTLYQISTVRVEVVQSEPEKPLRVKDMRIVKIYYYERSGGKIVRVGLEDKDPQYVDVPKTWTPSETECAELARQFVENWMNERNDE